MAPSWLGDASPAIGRLENAAPWCPLPSSADYSWPITCATSRPCTHTVTLSTATWADVRTVVLSEVMPG